MVHLGWKLSIFCIFLVEKSCRRIRNYIRGKIRSRCFCSLCKNPFIKQRLQHGIAVTNINAVFRCLCYQIINLRVSTLPPFVRRLKFPFFAYPAQIFFPCCFSKSINLLQILAVLLWKHEHLKS